MEVDGSRWKSMEVDLLGWSSWDEDIA